MKLSGNSRSSAGAGFFFCGLGEVVGILRDWRVVLVAIDQAGRRGIQIYHPGKLPKVRGGRKPDNLSRGGGSSSAGPAVDLGLPKRHVS